MQMTAPDYRPYLAATDLRTPEDVLAWLDSRALTAPAEPVPSHSSFWVLASACDDLRAQIARERRQACRRGALVLTRYIGRLKLWLRSDYAQNNGAERFGTFAKCMAHQRETRWGSDLRLALAFRAAARHP